MSSEAIKPMLGVYGLSHFYGLKEVSFEAHGGELIALLGPNGSGKSTLLKKISGLLAHTSGVIRYYGTDLHLMESIERAKRMTYLSSDFRTEFPLRVKEAVSFGRLTHGEDIAEKIYDSDAVKEAMSQIHCLKFSNAWVDDLSGGEKQLVLVARSLVQGARLLLLDETMSKMDLNHQKILGQLLKNLCAKGYLVIFVSHDINLAASWSSRCLFMKDGKLIKDGPTQSVFSEETFRLLYPETDLKVIKDLETQRPRVVLEIN